ncbi:hypothetical protein GP486_001640 [Trichoglossum hirsutum]|uniref:VWFA domain-containing protein n=1 Tax=Trichoglossum hirsutum TaxID=265104 RepID=A0A9P8RSW7_9PEZI|nr:hypothetical protein GP486_001640 [Trichoglossum hirsutum]
MAENDPSNLRLDAGRALVNDWLIPSKHSGSAKPDLVTVIDFSSSANLDYPLGDPRGANRSFNTIIPSGGTYIAGGVQMATQQLTSGSGNTADRSAIIVFTDGEVRLILRSLTHMSSVWRRQDRRLPRSLKDLRDESALTFYPMAICPALLTHLQDSDTASLVGQINRAAGLGIRVSFGFLDSSGNTQDRLVLLAIQNSGGIYSTIFDAASSKQFINLVLVNGITKNDNLKGSNSTLIAGLSLAHIISGSQTQSITYNALPGEVIDFSVQSIDAGDLTVQAMFGDKTLNSTTVNDTQSFFTSNKASDLFVRSPGDGEIDIKVTAKNAAPDSIFIVGATSNMPIQNCTVPVTGGGGKSKKGAIAAGVTVPIIVIAALVCAFYWWKHVNAGKPVSSAPGQGPPGGPEKIPPTSPMSPGDTTSSQYPQYPPQSHAQNPQNKHKFHKYRFKMGGDDSHHHHHLDREHPCYDMSCPLSDPAHRCQDPNIPCACEDEKCVLNGKDHKCDERWKCPCIDKECPVTKKRKREQRMKGGAVASVKAAFSVGSHM